MPDLMTAPPGFWLDLFAVPVPRSNRLDVLLDAREPLARPRHYFLSLQGSGLGLPAALIVTPSVRLQRQRVELLLPVFGLSPRWLFPTPAFGKCSGRVKAWI